MFRGGDFFSFFFFPPPITLEMAARLRIPLPYERMMIMFPVVFE